MKYTLVLSLAADGGEHRGKTVLAAGPSELPWHVALKVLGLILFWEEEPRVEEGVGWHYKPDLVALGPDGRIRLWVDCGNVAVRKIDRVAARVGDAGRFVILRRQRSDAEALAGALAGKVRHRQRVEIWHFDRGFVDALAGALDATNEVRAERSGGSLRLAVRSRRGEQALASRVHVLDAGAD